MAGDEKKNIHKLFKEYSSDHDKTYGNRFCRRGFLFVYFL